MYRCDEPELVGVLVQATQRLKPERDGYELKEAERDILANLRKSGVARHPGRRLGPSQRRATASQYERSALVRGRPRRRYRQQHTHNRLLLLRRSRRQM